MRDSSTGSDDRGNLERLGESAGSMAGRAADFGMEVSGALFKSAAEMLGGWWSSDAPREAATWTDRNERSCRTHYEASAASGTAGATQATHAAPKSPRGAMQSAGLSTTTNEGEVALTGSATIGDTTVPGGAATDGFERVRAGYQLGYVARQNPAYRGRSFSEVEPDLQRVWESRSKTQGSGSSSTSSWPEVRGFVDFAYQQDG